MRRGGGPLTVLALAQAAATYEFTVAFVALPAIVVDLHVAPSHVPLVPGAYAVVFGGGLLAAGRLTDRLGAGHACGPAEVDASAADAAGGDSVEAAGAVRVAIRPARLGTRAPRFDAGCHLLMSLGMAGMLLVML